MATPSTNTDHLKTILGPASPQVALAKGALTGLAAFAALVTLLCTGCSLRREQKVSHVNGDGTVKSRPAHENAARNHYYNSLQYRSQRSDVRF